MEQSQYLKNLLKRLNEATDQLQYKQQASNPHTISTIKFERDELESNANYSKRQYIHSDDINKQHYQPNTFNQGTNPNQNVLGQISMIDNTKTSRNNPILKFNPSKSRKKSQGSHYRQLQSKRQPTTRRDKKDLIEVRDKLNDIISFLNTKIQSNPQVPQIKKIVNMEDVKQSISIKNIQVANVNKSNDVLHLPKYRLNDTRLDKSMEILNHLASGHTDNKEYLNLKHSFDKLNDMGFHSIKQAQKPKFFTNHPQQNFQRNNLHIFQPNQRPANHMGHQIRVAQPNIFINGRRLNESVSQSNSFFPSSKLVRPFSQAPSRYVSHSPNFQYPQNNNSKIIIRPPIAQQTPLMISPLPSKYPNALNIGPPSFRRIVNSRPLSTKRINTQPINHFPRQQKTNPAYLPLQNVIPINKKQQQKIVISNYSQQDLQKSRLKKKTSLNHFYQQLRLAESKNVPDNIQVKNHQRQTPTAKEQLQQILPLPKPYKTISNIENPFKKPELSISKQSQRMKASLNNDVLQSIAQQSEENQLTRKLQTSGKSSERMMSSVNSNLYLSKVNKFEAGGSTKLKRKGIDVSSKQFYMSQYNRRP